MPSIKISHCLICDSVREEQRNKMTLLGFFGLASSDPSSVPVEIQLQDLNLPVNEIAFVFVGSAAGGSATQMELAYELFDWGDKPIFAYSQPQVVKPAERSNFVVGIRLLKFPHTGRYKIRMRVDGRPVYTGEFLIAKMPTAHGDGN
jgi:hypothetical protein